MGDVAGVERWKRRELIIKRSNHEWMIEGREKILAKKKNEREIGTKKMVDTMMMKAKNEKKKTI